MLPARYDDDDDDDDSWINFHYLYPPSHRVYTHMKVKFIEILGCLESNDVFAERI